MDLRSIRIIPHRSAAADRQRSLVVERPRAVARYSARADRLCGDLSGGNAERYGGKHAERDDYRK